MIDLKISTQPDDESCGPTSLHAIYQYYGLDIPLQHLVETVDRSVSGGTLAPMLGKHALQNGFKSTIYINNVDIFDPTWFHHGQADNQFLIAKITEQLKYKNTPEMERVSEAIMEYLALGGVFRFETLKVQLLKRYFNRQIPIITGLSATYLYKCAREVFSDSGEASYDDVRGEPCGHFVILCGYDDTHRHVVVADPHRENPISHNNYYKVSVNHLINAILLGVLTYDAALLIIEPQ